MAIARHRRTGAPPPGASIRTSRRRSPDDDTAARAGNARTESPESRQRHEARCVFLCGPGQRHRDFVARHLALELQLPLQPPHRRMPTRHHAHDPLDQLRDIVVALHVGPLMHHNAIEIPVAELLEESTARWQSRGHRARAPLRSERRSRAPDVSPAGGPHPRPVLKAGLPRWRTVTTLSSGLAKCHGADREPERGSNRTRRSTGRWPVPSTSTT